MEEDIFDIVCFLSCSRKKSLLKMKTRSIMKWYKSGKQNWLVGGKNMSSDFMVIRGRKLDAICEWGTCLVQPPFVNNFAWVCVSLRKCKANRRPVPLSCCSSGKHKRLSERIYVFIKHLFLRFHTSRELSAVHDLRQKALF